MEENPLLELPGPVERLRRRRKGYRRMSDTFVVLGGGVDGSVRGPGTRKELEKKREEAVEFFRRITKQQVGAIRMLRKSLGLGRGKSAQRRRATVQVPSSEAAKLGEAVVRARKERKRLGSVFISASGREAPPVVSNRAVVGPVTEPGRKRRFSCFEFADKEMWKPELKLIEALEAFFFPTCEVDGREIKLPLEEVRRRPDYRTFYAPKALLRRESLRYSRGVQTALRELWRSYTSTGNSVMGEEAYIEFFRHAQEEVPIVAGGRSGGMIGSLDDDEGREAALERDWLRDSRGDGELDFQEFTVAMFQLTDVWTTKISEESYVRFIRLLTNRMTRVNSRGIRVMRYFPKSDRSVTPPPREPSPIVDEEPPLMDEDEEEEEEEYFPAGEDARSSSSSEDSSEEEQEEQEEQDKKSETKEDPKNPSRPVPIDTYGSWDKEWREDDEFKSIRSRGDSMGGRGSPDAFGNGSPSSPSRKSRIVQGRVRAKGVPTYLREVRLPPKITRKPTMPQSPFTLPHERGSLYEPPAPFSPELPSRHVYPLPNAPDISRNVRLPRSATMGLSNMLDEAQRWGASIDSPVLYRAESEGGFGASSNSLLGGSKAKSRSQASTGGPFRPQSSLRDVSFASSAAASSHKTDYQDSAQLQKQAKEEDEEEFGDEVEAFDENAAVFEEHEELQPDKKPSLTRQYSSQLLDESMGTSFSSVRPHTVGSHPWTTLASSGSHYGTGVMPPGVHMYSNGIAGILPSEEALHRAELAEKRRQQLETLTGVARVEAAASEVQKQSTTILHSRLSHHQIHGPPPRLFTAEDHRLAEEALKKPFIPTGYHGSVRRIRTPLTYHETDAVSTELALLRQGRLRPAISPKVPNLRSHQKHDKVLAVIPVMLAAQPAPFYDPIGQRMHVWEESQPTDHYGMSSDPGGVLWQLKSATATSPPTSPRLPPLPHSRSKPPKKRTPSPPPSPIRHHRSPKTHIRPKQPSKLRWSRQDHERRIRAASRFFPACVRNNNNNSKDEQ